MSSFSEFEVEFSDVVTVDNGVTDVRVNGSSVVQNKIAYVTVPTEMSWDKITNRPEAIDNVQNNRLWEISVNQSEGLVFLDANNLI